LGYRNSLSNRLDACLRGHDNHQKADIQASYRHALYAMRFARISEIRNPKSKIEGSATRNP
jgi:hypothetical protein